MKIAEEEAYEKICIEMEEKGRVISVLEESHAELIQRRDKIFSKIILDNKLLQGTWEIDPRLVHVSCSAHAESLKHGKKLSELMKSGYHVKGRSRLEIGHDDDTRFTLSERGIGWSIEIVFLYDRDFAILFEFLKEQKMRLVYPIVSVAIRNNERVLTFLKALQTLAK